jgi:hypothetical protein
VDHGLDALVGQHAGQPRRVTDVAPMVAQAARTAERGHPLERHGAAVGEVVDHDDVPPRVEQIDGGVAADVPGAPGQQDVPSRHTSTLTHPPSGAAHRAVRKPGPGYITG